MATRTDLPDGKWVELRDPDELTGADYDAWQEAIELVNNEQDVDQPEPDPDNPAVMAAPAERSRVKVRFTMAGVHDQRDAVLASVITSWGYPMPLPYRKAYRRQIPLRASRVLDDLIDPHLAELRGNGPDPKEATTSTSGSTSKDDAPAPQPVSAPGPSATVSG